MQTILIILLFALAFGIWKYGDKAKAMLTPWRIGPFKSDLRWMPNPLVMQGDGWAFDFPAGPLGLVKYVQWFLPPKLEGMKELRVRFTVTGGDFIAPEYPENRAVVSLLIQRKGDDWQKATYRWYSSEVVTLAAGEFEIVAPLDVAHWGDMMGGHDPAAFQAALRDVSNIGLVFGSDGGRGHGVRAGQPSRFTLLGKVEVR